ncbi:MAG: methyltransferase domain-containing protein [Candidatus Bathyarchaeota archaeon]|jgi:SAM-dependent methyltransferase
MSRERMERRWLSTRRYNSTLSWGDVPYSVAPYVPTPHKVVTKMLKLARIEPNDVVFDLGCGDGRILFAAVEEFGASKAVGYDINASLCESLRTKVEVKGLEDRIEVLHKNFFKMNISEATVVTVYLTTSGNSKLRPKLEEELRIGARVVSHDFPFNDWVTDKPSGPHHYTLGSHKIFLYNIPQAYQTGLKGKRSTQEDSRWKRLRELLLGEEP